MVHYKPSIHFGVPPILGHPHTCLIGQILIIPVGTLINVLPPGMVLEIGVPQKTISLHLEWNNV